MTRGYAELVREVGAPLLSELGSSVPIEQEGEVLALVVSFWNASVRASKRRRRHRVKELNELKSNSRGRNATAPRRSTSSPSASTRTGSPRDS